MHIRNILPVLSMTPTAKVLLALSGIAFVVLSALPSMGILPLGLPDFLFLLALTVMAAAYRPGWAFLFLVATLPIEIVNLAPASIGIGIRPYQFLALSIYAGLIIRYVAKRSIPERPRINGADVFLFLIPLGSVLAAVNAPDKGVSLRLSLILFTFFALYWLFRTYVRTSGDVGRIFPFFILSSILSAAIAIGQNIMFLGGNGSFEVMPGRPNGLFAEPDWLGMFLISSCSALFAAGYLMSSRSVSLLRSFRMKRSLFLFLGLAVSSTALILTVSRSAWLGAAVSGAVSIALALVARRPHVSCFLCSTGFAALFFAYLSIVSIPLTNFDLFGRAESVGSGLQTITVSCMKPVTLPEKVASIEELTSFGCMHIDLEAMESQREAGRFVTTIDRDDPNVSIRKAIFSRAVAIAREHPVLGVGWGTISGILGRDGRGAGLNASDIFLETWLGSGLLGLIGLLGFLTRLAYRALRDFRRFRGTFPFFLVTLFSGLIVFDLFNSGILLGFVWAIFGISGSYLSREAEFSETL